MRAFVVVDVPPGVKTSLHVNQSNKTIEINYFCLECAVETFVLTVRLRVVRAAVANVNTQADEPHAKPGQRALPAVTPGCAVIGVDALR